MPRAMSDEGTKIAESSVSDMKPWEAFICSQLPPSSQMRIGSRSHISSCIPGEASITRLSAFEVRRPLLEKCLNAFAEVAGTAG